MSGSSRNVIHGNNISATCSNGLGLIICIGLVVIAFVLPWRSAVDFTTNFSVAIPIAALLILVWSLQTILSGRNVHFHIFHIFAFFYVVLSGLSVLWSVDPQRSFLTFIVLIGGVMFSLMIWNSVKNRNQLTYIMLGYVLGCIIVMSVELFYFFIQKDISRVGGHHVFLGPNGIANIIAPALPVAWYLSNWKNPNPAWYYNLLGKIFIGFATITILLTRSRQGFLFLIGFYLFYMIFIIRENPKLRSISIVGIVMILPVVIMDGERIINALPIERMLLTFGYIFGDTPRGVAGFGTRLDIYFAGLQLFAENPFLGTGVGAFRTAAEIYGITNHPHSNFVAVIAETGLAGLILFLAVLITILKTILQMQGRVKMISLSLYAIFIISSLVEGHVFITLSSMFQLTLILLLYRLVD